MAHFAELDSNNIVLRVIVLDNTVMQNSEENSEEEIGIKFLKNLFGENTIWKQTSYNTKAGIYYLPNGIDKHPDQSKAFRKNYAAIGWVYDSNRDAFINPKPVVLPNEEQYVYFDEFACLWGFNPPQQILEVTRV